MKTTYWLVAAAAVAAVGVTVYPRVVQRKPLPNVALVADAHAAVPSLPLPPVVLPPEDPVVLPPVPDTGAVPPPLPLLKTDATGCPDCPKPGAMSGPPVVPVSANIAVPPAPTLPKPPGFAEPLPLPALPSAVAHMEPLVPPAPDAAPAPLPASPSGPAPLTPPLRAPVPVAVPTSPPVLQPPVSPAPPKSEPLPLPAPTELKPQPNPDPLQVVGKYIVLKGDKLIEGAATVNNDVVVVRQGALDRPFPKSQVQYVAATRDEVYRFMLAKVSANDAAARLQVARWCMFSGLREQALTESREVLKLKPDDKAASSLARSLELSLREFPASDSPKMSAPEAPTFPTELVPAPVRPMSVPAEVPVPPMPPVVAPVFPPPAPQVPLAPKPVAPPPLPGPPVVNPLPPALPQPVPVPLPVPSLPAPPVPVLPAADPLLPPLPVPVPAPVAPLPKPVVPAIPPADPLLPPKPVVPPIPPAALVPASKVVPASKFGTDLPPKPPVTGPTGGDEFDPTGFNLLPKK